ncbi:spectrin beta chain [Elysia marginata]|uniref:Spectrin beta chain n=1 Tax=Elysia marginata TaxID=1093978 RepID=A0AAV4J9W7_9GAST|nr:spectrin beta chain [Elysia marginata]
MTEIENYANNVRWDPGVNDDDFDAGNNSSKLFERSRIKALAGHMIRYLYQLTVISCIVAKANEICATIAFSLSLKFLWMKCTKKFSVADVLG